MFFVAEEARDHMHALEVETDIVLVRDADAAMQLHRVLHDQLAAYAGAERIVFAEGSALHGRQLLGRLEQDIAVLRRRPGKRMAEASLRPRCQSLRYHDVGDQILMAYWKSGAKRPNPALSLYDVGLLLRSLDSLGIDLRADWDDAAYAHAALADVEAWAAWHQPKPARLAEYRAIMEGAGLTGRKSGLA